MMESAELIELERARSTLSKIWFLGCGIIFVILLAQSFGSVYRGHLSEVWSWAMPTMLPTLSLIISVLGADALVSKGRQEENEGPKFVVRRSFYRIAFWLSILYIALIFISVIGQPLMLYCQTESQVSPDDVLIGLHSGKEEAVEKALGPADMLKISNLWLAPFQSLAVGALGVLFFSKTKSK